MSIVVAGQGILNLLKGTVIWTVRRQRLGPIVGNILFIRKPNGW